MPLTTPSFTASESLANPDLITLTDDSAGSDATLTTRRVYFHLPNGNWLNTAGESTTIVYETWPYADVSITLDILGGITRAMDITVEWYDNSTLKYSLTTAFYFNLFDILFGLQVLQGNTSAPDQIQDTNFFFNLIQFIVNVNCEEWAITYGSDIYSSQNAANKNLVMINNEGDFF